MNKMYEIKYDSTYYGNTNKIEYINKIKETMEFYMDFIISKIINNQNYISNEELIDFIKEIIPFIIIEYDLKNYTLSLYYNSNVSIDVNLKSIFREVKLNKLYKENNTK
ncbi:MAG: hypothetical protein M0R46_14160 [Candidatus Muirbacterium halophilum]|nr:hypothetical protein [Candidatus Muirbacterium halophilum]